MFRGKAKRIKELEDEITKLEKKNAWLKWEDVNGQVVVLDTNIITRLGYLGAAELLEKLERVVIPWPVLEQLIAFRKKAFFVKRTKEKYGKEPDFMQRMSERERDILRDRNRSILSAWPVFSRKIETGEWKILGSSSHLYFETAERKVDNGTEEVTVGKDIGSSDSRIIATCKALKEMGFEEVILLTKDKILRRRAEEEGFRTEDGLSNVVN